MNGHVEGPLVRGQKVRVVLVGTVERLHEGWELYCDGVTLALDSEAIVNIQFIDEQGGACLSPHPSKALVCLSPKGHDGSHSVLHADGLEGWPADVAESAFLRCNYQSPSGAYLCELARGHKGRHERRNHSPEGKESW
jgi:hypothetical protein